MHGTYIGNGRMLVATVWGGRLVAPADDLSIMPELVMSGSMEMPLTKFLINTVKPGQTVVDVGANIGYFTVLLGYLIGAGGRQFAYEANPALMPYLRDNLSINYHHDRTTLRHCGVYSSMTTLDFHCARRFMGNSSVHAHNEEYHRHYADDIVSVQVPAEPLDRLLETVPHIDLLKIDIEGGEYHAFSGMERLLQPGMIDTLVFELNRQMMQADWEPFCELIRGLIGRQFYTLDGEGNLVRTGREQLLAHGAYPFVVMR